MDIISCIESRPSWGCKLISGVHPVYGVKLSNVMKELDKTNISSLDVIHHLYKCLAADVNYNYSGDFEKAIKQLDKTMMSKQYVIDVLISFLDSNSEDHPSLEDVLDAVTTNLKSNNSYKAVILDFKKAFIRANI